MTNPLPVGVVLAGAQRWHRSGVIKYAVELGMLPILIVQPDERLPADIPISALVLTCTAEPSATELQTIATEINKQCRSWYVLPLDDYISETAAHLSEYATAACYSSSTAYVVFRKHLLRTRWNKFCQTHPELPLMSVEFELHHRNTILDSSAGYAMSLGPFIVKPDAYSGSVGVFFASDKGEVAEKLMQCAQVLYDETKKQEMHGITIRQDVLVEEAIPRKNNLAGCAEFTAHYLSFKGEHHLLGIAEKTIHPTTFIETGHVFPSPSFPADMLQALHTCTSGMLDDINVQNTISNWEFIITPHNRLAMVEGQLRPSGDHVMDLMEHALGTSPYTTMLKALQTGKLELDISTTHKISMINWPAPSKVLQTITAVHVPEKLPDGTQLNIDEAALKNTTAWQGPISWYDRQISIIATGVDAKDAMSKYQEVLKQCVLIGTDADGKEIRAGLII